MAATAVVNGEGDIAVAGPAKFTFENMIHGKIFGFFGLGAEYIWMTYAAVHPFGMLAMLKTGGGNHAVLGVQRQFFIINKLFGRGWLKRL